MPQTTPEPRDELVDRVRDEIARGVYVTQEKLEVSADLMLRELGYFA